MPNNDLKPTTQEERERWKSWIKFTGSSCDPNVVLRLIADVKRYRRELAFAAQSLLSYERSHGTGNGEQQAYDIARLLGYEDDLTPEAVDEWLRKESLYAE